MTYVRVDGADLYSETIGSGVPLLLLHGGFCSLHTLQAQANALAERFTVTAYERPGHGRTADTAGPYSFEASTAEAVAYLDVLGLDRVHVVGHSDGAIVGLMLAMRHTERVLSLVALSGNLDPSAFTSAPDDIDWAEAGVAPAGEPDLGREVYDELSPDGAAHAEVVLDKLRTLWATEPHIAPGELSAITAPTLVVSGDRDTIRIDHSALIASSIRQGQLCIVPGATHDLVSEKPGLLAAILTDFYDGLGASRP
ncbi:pimeloyl-ACP methyl ester carboxylesterase [Okibacterium sp. HSC-33S16]|uniref:alpha/beta fold hydrolase n=1 Tax=Okibacterium sp. HSC-33S16 TaxID=2910965 RepID=UPI0020A10E2F|nr:alpha/beta hydrolase [Okibacterium sp. HSC-33S16]MCP2032101.1 pimeloyl-ACP methyl ester carboxylesterase [Okibacterium sp. HSC-33S16]